MKHLTVPSSVTGHAETMPLTFYLALEEWAATALPPSDDYFFTWSVRPTVIIGRHQDLHAEVDVDLCRSMGIQIVRRRSGGGAVYADEFNVMFSFILHSPAAQEAQAVMNRVTLLVERTLRSMGIPVEVNGRNDLTLLGTKVAGYAAYRLGNRMIVHGTLLHTINPGVMGRVLTPSRAKLLSHGVTSVEARVGAILPFTSYNTLELREEAARILTRGTIELTPEQAQQVRILMEPYMDPLWLQGGPRLQSDASFC